MGRHRHRAERTVKTLGRSYQDARTLRRRLQHLIEQADTADEGWLELVAAIEDVEFRLRCVLRTYEQVFQRAPGTQCGGGGTISKLNDC